MDALLKDPSYASAKTLTELDAVIDTLKARANEPTFAKQEERTLALLLHRRAKLLFANGAFEKARQDLSLLWGEEEIKARDTTSFVLQTLGYLDAARTALSSSADQRSVFEPAAAYLERRAFLHLAKEEYAEAAADFGASLRLDSRTQDKRILFQGLALRLAGKPMSGEFVNWDPRPKNPRCHLQDR
jgi:tetratricopeptide (TPR) repeat protein